MAGKTLTRMDLSEAVFREVGLSRNESAQLVESVLGHLSDALARGESVKISSFGTSMCARRPPGSAATPRPAKKCRSIPAAC